MSTTDAATAFDACRERLQVLLRDRADIAVVETAIDSYPLGEEEKAALWLWAIAPIDPAPVDSTGGGIRRFHSAQASSRVAIPVDDSC